MVQYPDCKIFIVDDDISVRRGISLLLNSAGYCVEAFENVRDFLQAEEINLPGCILLDIFLGKESGLELQDAVSKKFKNIPIIYISGHGDIPMSVQALKNGAFNFLQKPVEDKLLFPAIDEAIKHSRNLVAVQQEKDLIKTKINSLTSREFEIFRYVIKGLLNKQIASELNIAEHTVKLHRGKITEKLGVKAVAEMVYLAEKLNIR